ncbi:hypothetical protein [Cupriavidus gilardii]|uniref:hypothetical protein n=1 Tax=Cupriavidus gilardii TaxID=82541 RepID=UPI00157461CA|nr:hypothetical protein [Cupriavidus gilardii]NSX02966.1 hypothetical protein [Cupriavidus gilardii]
MSSHSYKRLRARPDDAGAAPDYCRNAILDNGVTNGGRDKRHGTAPNGKGGDGSHDARFDASR